MPIHPDIRSRFSMLDQLGPGFSEADFARVMAEFEADPALWTAPNVAIADEEVAGPNGPIPVRSYASENRGSGVITWIHGGAFLSGGLDMRESHMVAAELASRAEIAVVTVDYRLARNGVRFPVPLDDAFAAWRWVREDFAPDARVSAIGGASAGATLAVGSAMRDRDAGHARADALLLAYPFLHFPNPAPDPELSVELAAELHPALRITPAFNDHVIRNYVGRLHALPETAVPGAGDVRNLPPASVVVAEYDDLRPSGELFARQIADAGGHADLHFAEGMPHGYLNRSPWLDEVRRTLDLFTAATARSPQ